MIRHFTASAIILDGGRVLLIEHRKLGLWLYPGGHVEPNEDPVQAVRREVSEEVGLEVDIVSDIPFEHPAITTLPSPFTILVEDIPDVGDGAHQHIDLVYACTPVWSSARHGAEYDDGHRWVPVDAVADLPTPPELPGLVATCATYVNRRAQART